MSLIGKTITQLPSLTSVTSGASIAVQFQTTTYNATISDLAKSDSFTNNLSNFYSNPSIITKNIYIPPGVNALIIGPTATTDPSVTIFIDSSSTLTIL
jgi:hypothetical protein